MDDDVIPNDTRPGPANATMLICPVNGCPWRHERVVPTLAEVVGLPWRGTFEDTVRAAAVRSAQADDEACRAHLAEHPVEDFVRTIAELRAELTAR